MTRKRSMLWLVVVVPLLVYLAICAALFLGQGRLLFPVGQVGPDVELPANAEHVAIAASSGDRLHGVYVPASRPGGDGLLILGFGGNGANARGTAAILQSLFPEAAILVFYYRGYPPSTGTPSAAALREDALRAHDFARERFRPRRIVAAGFSIGSAVAAHLSAERRIDGLILVTPFDSLGAVAGGHYPWLPVGLLFHNAMEPARDLARGRTPTAIIAGGRDTLIPAARTDALRRAAPALRFDRTIPDVGHNDIYAHPAFAGLMREALESLIPDH